MQGRFQDSIEEGNISGIVIPEDEIEDDYEPSERGKVLNIYFI